MEQQKKYTIPAMLRNSFSKFGTHQSLVFVGEECRTYGQLKEEVDVVSHLLISLGITKGDKVAILSSNMPNWGVSFFAIATIGAVAVPILPDFSPNEITNILVHSESKAIFVSGNLLAKIGQPPFLFLKEIFDIENYKSIISSWTDQNIQIGENLSAIEVEEDDLASIIYTSGTTGKS